jgi:hypothetical protein
MEQELQKFFLYTSMIQIETALVYRALIPSGGMILDRFIMPSV